MQMKMFLCSYETFSIAFRDSYSLITGGFWLFSFLNLFLYMYTASWETSF